MEYSWRSNLRPNLSDKNWTLYLSGGECDVVDSAAGGKEEEFATGDWRGGAVWALLRLRAVFTAPWNVEVRRENGDDMINRKGCVKG